MGIERVPGQVAEPLADARGSESAGHECRRWPSRDRQGVGLPVALANHELTSLRERSGLTAPYGRGSWPALHGTWRLTSRDHRERWMYGRFMQVVTR
jgi:hypothetical protein